LHFAISLPSKPGGYPANHSAAVFYTQKMPFGDTLHRDIRAAIYGSDYLGPRGD
jgi:hypothetical protein